MKNIFRIIQISKPLYGLVSIIAILILFTALIELLTPFLSKLIVDEIVKQVQTSDGDLQRLALLIGMAFVAGLIGIIFTAITERLGDHFAGRLRKFLTEKFYHKILTLPQSYFDSEVSGKIANQLNRGIMQIQNFMNSGTNFILPTFLQSILTILFLAYYNVTIALFMTLLFPVYLWISYYSSKKWGKEEILKNQIEDVTRGRINEVINNIKLVKSFSNEKHEYKFVSENLVDVNKIYARQSNTFHILDFLRNFSLQIVLLAVNILVFYNTFQGSLSIGEMVLILQLINQARRPLFAMSFILTQVQNTESGSKEFLEILELPSAEHFDSQEKVSRLDKPTIRFENVEFNYETSKQVLTEVNFEIGKNEKVALVGHSGAGKSTVVNLILKFYLPTNGDVYMSGKSYNNLSPKFVRENISLVFQESELFSATIKENVAYGNPGSSEKQVIAALKTANAYDFVKKFPKGIDSQVGERGVRLSGGQKQRIQIARAILKNAPILILDEATSSLDAKSEREVQEALEQLMKNKLVIIIAHRFSTIQDVNKVLVISDGRIVDSGNPQELSRKPGIYSDLLKYQIEGNKKLLEQFEIY